jgi:hypothetical protein
LRARLWRTFALGAGFMAVSALVAGVIGTL